jgi:hypothetical protein
VNPSQSTCWGLIQGAANGGEAERSEFVLRYGHVARAYFEARWSHRAWKSESEDALQEVFIECFRAGGVLERACANETQSFRAYFHGVLQNVARRLEADAQRRLGPLASSAVDLDTVDGAQSTLSEVLDRAWARALLQEALQLQRAEAGAKGEREIARLDLLRLRFEEGLPIRDIAARWGKDPVLVQREYLAARRDFRSALATVLRRHRLGPELDVEDAFRQLRSLLS